MPPPCAHTAWHPLGTIRYPDIRSGIVNCSRATGGGGGGPVEPGRAEGGGSRPRGV